MSAVISCQTSRHVAILTDGAVYSPKGVLLRIERKIDVSRKVPLAVTTRGAKASGDVFARKVIEIVEMVGFDDGMGVIADLVPVWCDMLHPETHVEMTIAGVSSEHGPRHMLWQSTENCGMEARALLHPGPNHTGMPCHPDYRLADMGIRKPLPGETAESYLGSVGIELMEWGRRYPATSKHRRDDPPEAGFLGGRLDLTVVDERGARVRTIHRWAEDKIGEKIDPFRASKTVVPITAGMNRQQRRQAERDARKRVA